MNPPTDPDLKITSRLVRRRERIAKWDKEADEVETWWSGGPEYRKFCEGMAGAAREKKADRIGHEKEDGNRRGGPMRKSDGTETWVVYKMTLRRKHSGMNAICRQEEWDAMELDRPGYHTLIQEGITNEGEAERLARGTLGDAQKSARRSTRSFTGALE